MTLRRGPSGQRPPAGRGHSGAGRDSRSQAPQQPHQPGRPGQPPAGYQPIPPSKMQRVARQREQRPIYGSAALKPRVVDRLRSGSGGVLKAIGRLFWGAMGWRSPVAADLPHMRMGVEVIAQKLAHGERLTTQDMRLLKAVAALLVSRAGQGAALGWQFWELYLRDPQRAIAMLLAELRRFEAEAAVDARLALQSGAGRPRRPQ